MFARGVLSLHTAPPSVTKTPASKSCVSATSKLIQIKALQVLYSGHLRKTGGRGSYRLVNATHAVQKGLTAKSSHSRTGHPTKDVHPEPAEGIFSDSSVLLTNSPNFNYSRTYVTRGGRGVYRSPGQTNCHEAKSGQAKPRAYKGGPCGPLVASLSSPVAGHWSLSTIPRTNKRHRRRRPQRAPAILQFSGAAARIVASNGWAWSKGRERRKRSARRAWEYFS